jgi:hypothetical protein
MFAPTTNFVVLVLSSTQARDAAKDLEPPATDQGPLSGSGDTTPIKLRKRLTRSMCVKLTPSPGCNVRCACASGLEKSVASRIAILT